jgi:hypothetical protein
VPFCCPTVISGLLHRGEFAPRAIMWAATPSLTVSDAVLSGDLTVGAVEPLSVVTSNVQFRGNAALNFQGPSKASHIGLSADEGSITLRAPAPLLELQNELGRPTLKAAGGGLALFGTLNTSQGSDIQSTGSRAIQLTASGNFFLVKGYNKTSIITSVEPVFPAGTAIVLCFVAGGYMPDDGSGNLQLAGPLEAGEDDTLGLVSDGRRWLETTRSKNHQFSSVGERVPHRKTDDGERGWARTADSAPALCDDAKFATVWTAHSLDKVFVTDQAPASVAAPITLAAARDEHCQFQLVVLPHQQLSNITVELAGMQDEQIALDVKLVEFVNVTAAVNPANQTGLFPDPLPNLPFGATLHATQGAAPFWLTLIPGPTAPAGLHTGAIVVGGSAGQCTVPITVQVYNFSVANRTQLTDSGLRVQRGLDRFFDREKGTNREIVQRYYTFMVDYRVNQQIFLSVYPYINANWAPDRSDVSLDTVAFDAALQSLLGRGLQQFRFPSPTNATMSGSEGGASPYLDENPGNPTHDVQPDEEWHFGTNISSRIFARSNACPPDSPYIYGGNDDRGVFCGENATCAKVGDCDDSCCLTPGHTSGCQGRQRCSTHAGGYAGDSGVNFDPEFKRLFTLLYSKVCEHLRGAGILDKARVSYYDEPTYTGKFNSEALLALNALFFETCPGVHLWQDSWPVPYVNTSTPIYKGLTRDVSQWLVDWEQYVKPGVPAQVAAAHRSPAQAVTTMYDNAIPIIDCPGPPWRLSALSVSYSKSILYGTFVWARRALNSPNLRFLARAVPWTRTRSFPWMIASTDVLGDFAGAGLQGSLSWYSISTWCLPVTAARCDTYDPWVHANNIGPYGPPRDLGVQAAGFGSLIYPAREGYDELGPISSIRWLAWTKLT